MDGAEGDSSDEGSRSSHYEGEDADKNNELLVSPQKQTPQPVQHEASDAVDQERFDQLWSAQGQNVQRLFGVTPLQHVMLLSKVTANAEQSRRDYLSVLAFDLLKFNEHTINASKDKQWFNAILKAVEDE